MSCGCGKKSKCHLKKCCKKKYYKKYCYYKPVYKKECHDYYRHGGHDSSSSSGYGMHGYGHDSRY